MKRSASEPGLISAAQKHSQVWKVSQLPTRYDFGRIFWSEGTVKPRAVEEKTRTVVLEKCRRKLVGEMLAMTTVCKALFTGFQPTWSTWSFTRGCKIVFLSLNFYVPCRFFSWSAVYARLRQEATFCDPVSRDKPPRVCLSSDQY